MSQPPGPPPPDPADGSGDAESTEPPTAPFAQQPQEGRSPYGQPQYGAPSGQPGYGEQQYGGPPYQSSQPGYGPAYGQPGYPAPPKTNGKATAALLTGISTLVRSWCCGAGLLGLVAVVLGVKARSEIRMSGGRQDGDGMALAGIITGAVAALIGLLALALIGVALLRSGSAGSSGDFGGY
jgi:hypothetical protein